MPPSFSKELFRCARGKMTFNVNSCKEKDKLIYFIEFGGGAVDKGQGPFTITLVDPGCSSGEELPQRDTFSSGYLLMCGIQNEILPLLGFRITKSKQLPVKYNPNDILQRKYSWDDAVKLDSVSKSSRHGPSKVPGTIIIGGLVPVVSIEDCDPHQIKARESKKMLFNQTNQESDTDDRGSNFSGTSFRGKRKRVEFTQAERNEIVKYVVRQKAFSELLGNELWKRMVKSVPNHTWQSLKEHFRKKIFPMISAYGLDKDIVAQFKTGMIPKKQSVDVKQNFMDKFLSPRSGQESTFQKAGSSGAEDKMIKEKDSGAITQRKQDNFENIGNVHRDDSFSGGNRKQSKDILQKTSPTSNTNSIEVSDESSESSDEFKTLRLQSSPGPQSSKLRKMSKRKEILQDWGEDSDDSSVSSRVDEGPSSLPPLQKLRTSPRKRRNAKTLSVESGDEELFSPSCATRTSPRKRKHVNYVSDDSNDEPYLSDYETQISPTRKSNFGRKMCREKQIDILVHRSDDSSDNSLCAPSLKNQSKLQQASGQRRIVRTSSKTRFQEDSDESFKDMRTSPRTRVRRLEKDSETSLKNVRASPRKKSNVQYKIDSDASSDKTKEESDADSFHVSESDLEYSDHEETGKSFNHGGGIDSELDDESCSIVSVTLSDDEDSDPQPISLQGAVGASSGAKSSEVMAIAANKNPEAINSGSLDEPSNKMQEAYVSVQDVSQMKLKTLESVSLRKHNTNGFNAQNGDIHKTSTIEHSELLVSANRPPSSCQKENRGDIHRNFNVERTIPLKTSQQALAYSPPLDVTSKGTSTSKKRTTASFPCPSSSGKPKISNASAQTEPVEIIHEDALSSSRLISISVQTEPVNIIQEVALSPSRLINSSVQTDFNFPASEYELEQIQAEPLISVPFSPGSALGLGADTESDKIAGLQTAAPESEDTRSKSPASPKVSKIVKKALRRCRSEPDLTHHFQEISPGRTTRAIARKLEKGGPTDSSGVGNSQKKGHPHAPRQVLKTQASGSSGEVSMSGKVKTSSNDMSINSSPKRVNNLKGSPLTGRETCIPKETSKSQSRRRTTSDTNSSPCKPTLSPSMAHKRKENPGLRKGEKMSEYMKKSKTKGSELNSEVFPVFTRAKAKLDQRPKRSQTTIKGTK